MILDRFIEPIFAYCASEFGSMKLYYYEGEIKKIINKQKELLSNNVIVYQYPINTNILVLIDLDSIIKALHGFRVAVAQIDITFDDADFREGWTPVYAYYKEMEKMYNDNRRLEQMFGFPNMINDYSFKKMIEAIDKIANQYVIESGFSPFDRKGRMYKRKYCKQAEALIEVMKSNGMKKTYLTNIGEYPDY